MGLRHSSRCLLLRRKMAEADSSEVGTLRCPAAVNSCTGTASLWLFLWWHHNDLNTIFACLIFVIIAATFRMSVAVSGAASRRKVHTVSSCCADVTCDLRALCDCGNRLECLQMFCSCVLWSGLDARTYWTRLCLCPWCWNETCSISCLTKTACVFWFTTACYTITIGLICLLSIYSQVTK